MFGKSRWTNSMEWQQSPNRVQFDRIFLACLLVFLEVVAGGCGDAPIKEQSWTFSKGGISHLSFSKDSKTLYVGSGDGDLALLETRNWTVQKKMSQVGRVLHVLDGPKEDFFIALGFGRKGVNQLRDEAIAAALYSAADERTILNWVHCREEYGCRVLPILSADGKALIVLEREAIVKYDLETQKVERRFYPKINVKGSPMGLACWWRADETELCVIDSDGIIRTYNVADGIEAAPPTLYLMQGPHCALATTAGGDRVAIAHRGDLNGNRFKEERILIYDVKEQKEICSVETEGQGIMSVVFLGQNRVAASTVTGEILIWKLPYKKPAVRKFQKSATYPWLAASPDGKLLVAGGVNLAIGANGSVTLLDPNR